jgi:HPt (histidine-containing phosphotransfer) domain-containing protein
MRLRADYIGDYRRSQIAEAAKAAFLREKRRLFAQRNFKLNKLLLAYFAKLNGSRYEEITEALNGGDFLKARALAHSLKNNAGLIGNSPLMKAAESIEFTLIRGRKTVTLEQTERLETELNAALASIAPLIGDADLEHDSNYLEFEKALVEYSAVNQLNA